MKEQMVVWITGASSGMGQDLAEQYLKDGYQVVATARRQPLLEGLRQYCQNEQQLLIAPGDVTNEQEMFNIAKLIDQTFGRLDILIAGAGYAVYGTFEELELADYRRQFETNVMGVLTVFKAALPALKSSGGQAAIIGSVSGHIGLPRRSAYAMSKYALRGLAEAIGIEFAADRVGVTLIAPGYIDTPTREMDNRGVHSPGEKNSAPKHLLYPSHKAAQQIRAAVQRRKSFHVITGHGILTVWVQRLLPGLIPAILRLRQARS